MILVKYWSLVLMFLGLLSCSGDDDENRDLSITALPDFATLLPGTTDSCFDKYNADAEDSVAEFHVRFSNLQLEWLPKEEEDKDRVLSVVYLQLQIRSSQITGGEFETVLNEEEIEFLLGAPEGFLGTEKTVNSNQVKNHTDSAGNPATYGPCSLKFGGIPLVDKDSKFSASGSITIVAIADKPDGSDPRVLRTTFPVKIRKEF